MRARATLTICAVTLALAGCNAQRADELSANVAAAAPVEGPSAAASATEPPEAAINPAAAGVPLPPVRPDFAKLAREKAESVAATPIPTAAQPAEEGGSTVAQAPSAPPPTGIFSIFVGAPADPASPIRVAAASPMSASDANPPPGSLNAYERRVSGDEPDDTRPVKASPRITPGATIEVNGVIRTLPQNASPVLIAPSPRIAASFGPAAGERWRPAYDNVVTDCFPADLRRALNSISEHFNSEVLVTSGARGNGRRRSMHRSCRAADIRIVGVSPGTVARYASTVPGINGVGTYRRVAVTHVDIRENKMAWRY